MKGLTKEQLDFLRRHGVPLEKVFDAKGYSKSDYYILMKKQDKIVAFNVTPCKVLGHTLRTRNGHCVQCNTAHLEFQKRHDYSGIIYIAGSKKGKVLKVGYSKDIGVRSESLNRTKYAGFNDWEILFGITSSLAGEIESKMKSKLSKYSRTFFYEHDNKLQDTYETFSCSFNKAKSTLITICEEHQYSYEVKRDYDGIEYNFHNLKRL